MNNLNQKELLILLSGLDGLGNEIGNSSKLKIPVFGVKEFDHIEITDDEIYFLKLKLGKQYKEGLHDN